MKIQPMTKTLMSTILITTLSLGDSFALAAFARRGVDSFPQRMSPKVAPALSSSQTSLAAKARSAAPEPGEITRSDRKSTRLNSSH